MFVVYILWYVRSPHLWVSRSEFQSHNKIRTSLIGIDAADTTLKGCDAVRSTIERSGKPKYLFLGAITSLSQPKILVFGKTTSVVRGNV